MDFTFTEGQIVWAKLAGYPWWPASIKQVLAPDRFEVEYFGEFERNYFDSSRVRHFSNNPEKVNRRNPKLLESLEQAQRVLRGESTVEDERLRYFSRKLETQTLKSFGKRCATQNDLSTNYSVAAPAPLSSAPLEVGCRADNECDVFVEDELPASFDKFIKTDINRTKRAKGLQPTTRKRRVEKQKHRKDLFMLTRFVSLPAEMPRKRASLPQLEEIYLSEEGHETEGQKSVHLAKGEDSGVRSLETSLREISALVMKDRPPIVDIQARLTKWIADFKEQESRIDQVFDTDVGPVLIEIISRCAVLSSKPVFRELHATSLLLFETIKTKLLSGFFKSELVDHPKFEFSISPLPATLVSRKKPIEYASEPTSQSCGPSSNCGLGDFRDTDTMASCTQSKNTTSDKKENESICFPEEHIFKLSKKLARLLYDKVAFGTHSRAECEQFANAIESRIRAVSKSMNEYKKEWVRLFHRLEYNSERFLLRLKNATSNGLELPIMDLMHSFLITK